MGLGNLIETINHYFLIKGITYLGRQGGVIMVSIQVCIHIGQDL